MASGLLLNPLDPVESQLEQTGIDRQRAIAAALQKESLTAPEGQMISGHYIPPSWTQYLGKVGQGLSGSSMQADLDRKTLEYQRNSNAALLQALGGGQSNNNVATALQEGANSGSIGPTVSNAALLRAMPSPPVNQGESSLNPIGMNPQLALRMLTTAPDKFLEAQAAAYKPTEVSQLARAAGANIPEANKAALIKALNIPFESFRPGGYVRNPADSSIMQLPHVPEGYQATQTTPGQFAINAVPGGMQAITESAAAKARGPATYKLEKTFNPVTGQEEFQPATNVSDAAQFQIPPGQQIARDNERLAILQQERQNPRNSAADNAALDREIARTKSSVNGSSPMLAAPPMGLPQSIKGNVDVVNRHYENLTASNESAPADINALNAIKKYAPGAITGAQADKLEVINGLKTLIPGFEWGLDKKTQTDLLNKNAARIAAAGSGQARATDALRDLVAASNPNTKMTAPAIAEAVDQLVAIKKMNLSAQQLFDPLKQSNNIKGYQEALSKFNRVADPDVWKISAMPANQLNLTRQKMIKAGTWGGFVGKVKELQGMGVNLE